MTRSWSPHLSEGIPLTIGGSYRASHGNDELVPSLFCASPLPQTSRAPDGDVNRCRRQLSSRSPRVRRSDYRLDPRKSALLRRLADRGLALTKQPADPDPTGLAPTCPALCRRRRLLSPGRLVRVRLALWHDPGVAFLHPGVTRAPGHCWSPSARPPNATVRDQVGTFTARPRRRPSGSWSRRTGRA
jgi:hypothetical protein